MTAWETGRSSVGAGVGVGSGEAVGLGVGVGVAVGVGIGVAVAFGLGEGLGVAVGVGDSVGVGVGEGEGLAVALGVGARLGEGDGSAKSENLILLWASKAMLLAGAVLWAKIKPAEAASRTKSANEKHAVKIFLSAILSFSKNFWLRLPVLPGNRLCELFFIV